MTTGLMRDAEGVERCWWPGDAPDYLRYHDEEWGRPTADDTRLFEKIALEGFQSGLSWITILRKRQNFRKAFAGFDPVRVAAFGARDVDRLLGDAGIVRHRGKIEATINNAARVLDVVEECGSLAALLWSFEPKPRRGKVRRENVPAHTEASEAMAKALRKRGFRFFGPTTAYAFMQSMGMVNDHLHGCHWREVVEAERAAFERPG